MVVQTTTEQDDSLLVSRASSLAPNVKSRYPVDKFVGCSHDRLVTIGESLALLSQQWSEESVYEGLEVIVGPSSGIEMEAVETSFK